MAQQQDPNQDRQQKTPTQQDQPDRSFGTKDRGLDQKQEVNTGRSSKSSIGATEADEDLISSDDRRSSTSSRPATDANTSGAKKAF